MNKHILSLTAGVLFTTGAFTQEIAHTASLTVPMPLNFAHAGDAIQNYAASAGMRYTFRSAGISRWPLPLRTNGGTRACTVVFRTEPKCTPT